MSPGSSDVPPTDFAITTVNVPDRLDMREFDDRKKLDEESRLSRIDLSGLRAFLPRLIGATVVAALLIIAWQVYGSWRNSVAAGPLADRLSASLGVPVTVDSSQVALSPSPRLVLSKVTLNGDVELGTVSVKLTTRHVAKLFQHGAFHWGEIDVGATRATVAQGRELMQLLPRLTKALPQGVGMVRVNDLQFPDQPLLAGSWQVGLERGPNGDFGKVSARQEKGNGWVQFHLTSDTAETVGFEMLASHWVFPVGPSFPIETGTANGKVSLDKLEISPLSLSGNWGEMHGTVNGASDGGWTLQATLQSEGIDLDSLLRQMAIAPPKPAEGEAPPPANAGPVMQGSASFNGKLEGKGASLEDAVNNSVLVAPLHVRSAVLNGINLGFVAMNPASGADPSGGGGGGSTRFATLDADLVSDSSKTSITNLHARAGALLALGEVSIAGKHELSGLLHVDLGATRVLAPIRVHVRGTLEHPKFGR